MRMRFKGQRPYVRIEKNSDPHICGSRGHVTASQLHAFYGDLRHPLRRRKYTTDNLYACKGILALILGNSQKTPGLTLLTVGSARPATLASDRGKLGLAAVH